ncbi:hypothetical protein EJ03DRAFT_331780 [Teratosphaeria nubilosa]|uniref:UBX domain-containing protein n=1 Tax=Teratosphaeria nubilosa TaxID=161662 RepID=A0A6G1KVQ1_9PEZI|nr:hypothetical protein EJ03DRAFT_331780 [Teratosphaeria nubilosa]
MANPDFDITSLNEEQQLALQQYTSVTDQELDQAVPLLQRCQWNAQIAITRFFDGDADTVDPVAEAARAPPPSETARRAEVLMDGIPSRASTRRERTNGLEPAPRVVPTPEIQLSQPVPFPLSILLLPLNLTYIIFQRIFGAVGYVFPFLPRLLSRFYTGRASQPSRDAGRRPLNPRDSAARFMRELEEDYGVAQGQVPFYQGGYSAAYDEAKRDLRWLMVILISPEHDYTPKFVQETLHDPELIAFINDPSNNIIVWGGSVRDAEAYQVANALNATQFPFITAVVHTPSVSSTAMSKVATFNGAMSAQHIINKMQSVMESQRVDLDRIRRQRQEQQASRNLRQEQESAYERSLAQDREKARKRKEEQAAREKAEREEREREEQKADHTRKVAQWRTWRARSIPSEPDAYVKEAVRVSIRMPDGERVVRKFGPDADLEELYAYVECYDLLKEDAEVQEKEVSKPAGYEHEYQFQLVSPMPREVYELAQGGSIRGRIGRSGNLIVERTITEDDDEDEGQDA